MSVQSIFDIISWFRFGIICLFAGVTLRAINFIVIYRMIELIHPLSKVLDYASCLLIVLGLLGLFEASMICNPLEVEQ
jgi:hypothetical protein